MTKEAYTLTLCSGVEGDCLYLNNYRICGPKPWGGGTTVREWSVRKSDLESAVGLSRDIALAESERDTLKLQVAELQNLMREIGRYMQSYSWEINDGIVSDYATRLEKAAEASTPSPLLAYVEAKIREFATAILHGDEDHRAWLMEAAAAFAAGKPMPPARSSSAAYVEIGKLAVAVHKAGANWNEVQGGDWGEIMEAASAKLRAADEALSKACTSIIEKERVDAAND